jgi:hypothetical protein
MPLERGRDPAAVLYPDPLAPGPSTDFRRVSATAGRPAARPGPPPRARPEGLPAGPGEPGQRGAQLCRVRRAQVNLIASPVQPEPHRALSRTAVDVINQQSLHLPRHGAPLSIPAADELSAQTVNAPRKAQLPHSPDRRGRAVLTVLQPPPPRDRRQGFSSPRN